MTLEQQEKEFDAFVAKMKETMFKKGNDYAGTDDRLRNFKVAGACAGSTAEQNCLQLIATKVARLGQLLNSSKAPENESIEDSLLDLANYSFLLHCIKADKPVTFNSDSLTWVMLPNDIV